MYLCLQEHNLAKTKTLFCYDFKGLADFEGEICGHVLLQPGGYWWQCSLAYSSGDQSSGIGYFISDLKIAKASNS